MVTAKPSRRRRGTAPEPTAVAAQAAEAGIPVSFDPADAAHCGAELGVVLAYGRILRRPLLDALELVNLHLSLLPRWRGAAPVQRAILAGDAETGVCLMRIEEGLDTGALYGCRRVRIGAEETAESLTARLVAEGTELLLRRLEEGLGDPLPQQGEPSYAQKLSPEELRLEWSKDAEYLSRLVRVGRAWTTWQGRRLLVHRARPAAPEVCVGSPGSLRGPFVASGEGCLELLEVQPEGRGVLSAAEWLRGARPGAAALGS